MEAIGSSLVPHRCNGMEHESDPADRVIQVTTEVSNKVFGT